MNYIHKLSPKDKILDISVNLARVSDWILSDSEQKQRRVDQFLQETEKYVLSLFSDDVSMRFQKTRKQFLKEFEKLIRDRNQNDRYEWAERALTWANILQHRAKLA